MINNINMNEWKKCSYDDFDYFRQSNFLFCYGCTSSTPGRYLEDAFIRLGLNTERYQGDSKIEISKYDYIIAIESPAGKNFKLDIFSELNVPKIYWLHHGENRINQNKLKIKQFSPDVILMSHSLHLLRGISTPVYFFPFGLDPSVFKNNKKWENRKYDISFIGANSVNYNNRTNLLNMVINYCKKNKKSYFIKGGLLREQMAKVYSNSKIVINPLHDSVKSINMRIWEAIGSGCLLLTQEHELQSQLFQDHKDYIVFKDKNDLIKKISWINNNLLKIEEIRKKSYENIINNGCYSHRAKFILSNIRRIESEK